MIDLKKYHVASKNLTHRAVAIWEKVKSIQVSELLDYPTADPLIRELREKVDALERKVRELENQLEAEFKDMTDEEYTEKWEGDHWATEKGIYEVTDKLNVIDSVLLSLVKIVYELSETNLNAVFRSSDYLSESKIIRMPRL